MKKIFILLLLGVSIHGQAQVLIPKAGITLSRFSADGDDGQKSKVGLTAGVGFNLSVTKSFSIQPEVNFVQKGSRAEGEIIFDDFEMKSKSKITVNYLEV